MPASTAVSPTHTALDSDRPIASHEEDLLERGPLVEQLAAWVRQAPAGEGFVIGVTGPWGSGKTSVFRLLEEQLADEILVVRFDPWLFSRADELVARFFVELAGLLTKSKVRRIKKVGQRLADYGAALSPAAGVVLGPAGQLLAAPRDIAAIRQGSAAEQRQRLRERDAQTRAAEDEANQLLALATMLNVLRSELAMFVALKEDRAGTAWDHLVVAQNDVGAAVRAHPGASGFEQYSERLLLHERNLFPPQLFMSPGMTVGYSECSICSSPYGECVHVAGRAYMGEFCARSSRRSAGWKRSRSSSTPRTSDAASSRSRTRTA